MPQVYGDDQVTIEHIPALGWGGGNNSYIVRPVGGGSAVIVDVPGGFEAVLGALGDDEVSAIVLTHSHPDHWNGVDVLRSRISAPIYAGAEDAHIDKLRDVRQLADGDEVPVGGAALRVLHTPGHTPGSICLLINGAVLTGDTLFPGGPGHSFSPEALRQEIASITSKLYPLPDDTLVLPGHGDGATIGVSRAEYEIFASKQHADDLHGDVLWVES